MRTIPLLSALLLLAACASAPEIPAAEGEVNHAAAPATAPLPTLEAPRAPPPVAAPVLGQGRGPDVPLKELLPPGVAFAEDAETFGAALPAIAPIAFHEVVARPDDFAEKQVVVEAQIRSVCTKKGCWMELAELATPNGPGARVTFKDYGFFVPRDSAGALAKVAGVVLVKSVPKAEVDHLEAEGARFSKAADGTARELRIVATGVELRRPIAEAK